MTMNIKELTTKLNSLGYNVDDCTNWETNFETNWKFCITKKNDPTCPWQLCENEKDVKKFLDYVLKSKENKEQEEQVVKEVVATNKFTTDKDGYIICVETIPSTFCSIREEFMSCLKSIGCNDFYVFGASKGQHNVEIHCDLTEDRYHFRYGKHNLWMYKHKDGVYFGSRTRH